MMSLVDAPEGPDYTAAPSPKTEDLAPPAQPPEPSADDVAAGHRRLLLVALQESVVALPADDVVEVLPARPFARIPGAHPPIAGLVNRRGRMLTVVDVGVASGGEATSVDPEHRVVVVSWRGKELGLAVRDVLQITTAWRVEPEPGAAGEDEDDSGSNAGEEGGGGSDEQLRVVEPEAVLAPLFGGADGIVDAIATGKS